MDNNTKNQIAKVMMLYGNDEQLKEVMEYIGVRTSTPPSHPSYDTIHSRCLDMVKEFEGKFDLIVGVSRGGLLPGIILSHQLNLPFKSIDYSSKSGKGDNKISNNHIPEWVANNMIPTRVLFTEDIIDSGNTLKELCDMFELNNFHISSYTIYYKDTSVHIPTYYSYKISHDFGWVIFPFEA